MCSHWRTVSDDWDSTRREIAYQEARAVIEAQNQTMTDIDDKAMRTVRLTVVLAGVLLTAYQYSPATFSVWILGAAFLFLFLSAACGMVTYDESNLFLGPKGEYLEALAHDDIDGEDWDEDLLEVFAGMISENHSDITFNAWVLKGCLASLGVAVLCVAVAVVI